MSAAVPYSPAAEINRLHEEVARLSAESRQTLDAALGAAWQAGHLMLAEKKRVSGSMGRGAWMLWLERHFHGTPRTAQRYMRLAHGVADVSFLRGMSLRQAYARLGIATEPKTHGKAARLRAIAPHVFLANKLLRTLKRESRALTPDQCAAYRQDLHALFEELRPLFAPPHPPASSTPAANFAAGVRSNSHPL